MEFDNEDQSQQSKSIRCSHVPRTLLDRKSAKRYFEVFGQIAKISVKPKALIIIVHYLDSESANYAYNQAKSDKMTVEWYKKQSSRKKKIEKELDPDWSIDPEIQSELAAMGADIGVKRKYNLRPEAMVIGTEPVPKKEVKIKRTWKKEVGGAKSSNSEEVELINILKQPGNTTEEKFRLLEARDKLIRLKRNKKQIQLNSKATVGTCPDMCPEKERLMREVQHQVALYEQEIGERVMNHAIAVKQYSRSSADQESPLPHELRNVNVLQMTMGYLMHKIMNMCDNPDVNLAEWYHFLWDRTRGIRKDITQQELCCQGSVELVEQCARFHIHCSSRLVAEDPSVFDQKINTENLTKCLQTLKYMYHDLEIKGESCPNEAEFRAYVILLNLNDGNFMWEVQQLRLEIQESAQIKFALAVYSALDKNNYVKFFKLVRSTTYLNSCILLRYFNQVRFRALETLVKCYSPRSPSLFPIQELERILAFEGKASAIDFTEYYNLQLSEDKLNVVLDKLAFSIADSPYVLDRAVNIIESKRTSSVGEVVCGSELPPPMFQQHSLKSSFDDHGYLDISEFSEGEVAEPQEKVIVKERSNSPNCMDSSDIWKKKQPDFTKNIFTHSEKSNQSIFGGSLSQDAPITKIGEIPKIQFGTFQKPATNIFTGSSSIFGGSFDQPDKAVPKPAGGFQYTLAQPNKAEIIELKRKEEEKLRIEKEAQQKELLMKQQKEREEAKRRQLEADERRKAYEQQLRVQKETQLQLQKKIEKEKREKEKAILRELEEKKKRLAEVEKKKLEALSQMKEKEKEIKQVVTSVIEKLLADVEKKHMQDHRASYVISKWRNKVALNRNRKRKAIEQSPLWIIDKTPKETAKELYIFSQDDALSLMKRYKYGLPISLTPKNPIPITKIDLVKLTYNALIKSYCKFARLQSAFYWKVNICTPTDKESKAANRIEQTLKQYLNWKNGNGNNKMLLEHHNINNNKITYCLHNEENDFEANGYIFIDEKLTTNLVDKLEKLVNNLRPKVAIPIALILQKPSDANTEFKIINKVFTRVNIVEGINEALTYLAENLEAPPCLELNTLKAFLIQHLATELWKRVNSFAKWNNAYKKCITLPNLVINLYNQAVSKLKGFILNESCYEYAEFPHIFKEFLPSKIPDFLPCDYKYFPSFWRSPKYKQLVCSKLDYLILPEYVAKWPGNSQEEIENDIYNYCKVFKDSEKVFYKIMSYILRFFDGTQKSTMNILWTGIIEILAIEKINEINFNLNQNVFSANTIFNQLFVVYENFELNKYSSEAWFYLTNEFVKKEIHFDLNKPEEGEKRGYEERVCEIDLDKTWDEVISREVDEEYVNEMKNFEFLMKDLEESMSIQRQINSKLQTIMKAALDDV